ncbi:MAG: hypothetical protein OEQ13_11420, partial [Acidobacteriota bacterium]|nr:hypothetical protein [Acidobacteriota bacterium]
APVRWVDVMRALEREHGARTGLELGPGRVLGGLSRRINEDLRVLACGSKDSVEQAIRRLAGSMADERGTGA